MEYCLSILYVAMDELGMIWCMDAFMERRYKDWKFWVTLQLAWLFPSICLILLSVVLRFCIF